MLERDPINVLSVGRPLFEGQSSRNIWESIVGGSTSVRSVRMPSQEAPASFNIRESTVGQGPTSVLSMARPSDRGQTLVSPREFMVEAVPLSVASVGNCPGRAQLLLIRLLTEEQELFLCSDCRAAISQRAGR